MKKIIILIIAISLVYSYKIQSQVLFNDSYNYYQNFEDFKLFNRYFLHWWSTNNTEFGYDFNRNHQVDTNEYIKNIEITSNFGRDDNKSIKFRFRRLEPNIVSDIINDLQNGTITYNEYVNLFNRFARNQISTYVDHTNMTTYLPNEEYWFKFSIFIDNNYEFEEGNSGNNHISNTNIDNENIDIMCQWHFEGNPSAPTHPPISLQIVKDKWVLVRYPFDESTSNYHIETFVIGDVEKGVWTDWKFNIKFSSSNNGKIQIWENGIPKYFENNIVTIYKNFRLFWSIGIYKPHWWSLRTTTGNNEKKYYFDNINIYQNISLIDDDCGKNLSNSDMTITTETVSGNPEYHFRIDSNSSSNHVHTHSPTINLKNYSWVQPNTHYFVKIKIDGNPLNKYGEYAENPCEIWTPDHLAINLIRNEYNNCNKQLSNSDMTITSETISGNPEYHFRIDSDSSSNHVYTYSPTINLKDYSWVQPNTHYYVKVKIDGNPLNKYGEYADNPCEIWTPNQWWIIREVGSPSNANKIIPYCFPNPIIDNSFYLIMPDKEKIFKVQLFSIDKKINVPIYFNKSQKKVVILSSIKSGIYAFHIITKNNIYTKKIIIY